MDLWQILVLGVVRLGLDADWDPATPNDAFFKHVDSLLDYARQQGLVVAMLPTWGYCVNQAQVINLKNARRDGKWLGARYRIYPNSP